MGWGGHRGREEVNKKEVLYGFTLPNYQSSTSSFMEQPGQSCSFIHVFVCILQFHPCICLHLFFLTSCFSPRASFLSFLFSFETRADLMILEAGKGRVWRRTGVKVADGRRTAFLQVSGLFSFSFYGHTCSIWKFSG